MAGDKRAVTVTEDWSDLIIYGVTRKDTGVEHPVIGDGSDLRMYVVERKDTGVKAGTWIHHTAEGETCMGMAHAHPEEMMLDELAAGLVPLDDSDIYPEASAAEPVTVAAKSLDDATTFIKRCGFRKYPPPKQLVEKGFKARKHEEGYTAKD